MNPPTSRTNPTGPKADRATGRRPAAALLLFVVSLGALLTWWSVGRARQQFQAALLRQAKTLAAALDAEDLRVLCGSQAGDSSPGYARLKEELAAVGSGTPPARRVYVLGRRADGSACCLADSDPAACGDPSRRPAFASGTSPWLETRADSRGTRLSALVPIRDPRALRAGRATRDDARAIVREAVDFYRKTGRARLLSEVAAPQGRFRRGDLYAFVCDRDMTTLAHPVKPETVGVALLDKKDWAGGKYFRKEIRDAARARGRGWVSYEYDNPETGVLEPKTTYFELVDDLIVCSGAYEGTGAAVAVLGVDVENRDVAPVLVRAAVPPLLLTVALVALVALWAVGGARLTGRAARRPGGRGVARLFEPALAAAVGLALTAFAAWAAHTAESYARAEAFWQTASGQTARLADTLADLQEVELEGLARLYGENERVGSRAFYRYAEHLTARPEIQAWEWVPAVSAGDRGRFEREIRAAEGSDFEIWEKNARGERAPAAVRDVYYPVLRVAPLAGNELAFGFDLGSEPVRRAALATAARTGLATCTGPVVPVQEPQAQKALLVARPVFADDAGRQLKGYVLAVLRPGTLVRQAASDGSALVGLSLLRAGATPDPVAESWDEDSPPTPGLCATRPVFAFGKVFAVTAHAGPEFLAWHPRRAGWLAGLGGLVLTAALTVVLHGTLRRRETLEQLVEARTRELQESERSYRDRFALNSSVMLLLDPATGAVLDANAAAVAYYGYPRERLLSLAITDINTAPPDEVRAVIAAALDGDGGRFEFRHRLADGSERDVEVSTGRVQFGDRKVLHSIIHDVTTRKEVERIQRESEENFRVFVETMSDMVIVAAPDGGKILFTNDEVSRTLGYGKEELRLLRASDLHRPEDHAAAREGYAAVERGERESCTFQQVCKDGTLVPVETRVWRGLWDGREAAFGVGKNLSAEREAEQRFERLFRSNPALMALSSLPDRRFTDANDAFLDALGYCLEEIVGKTSAELELFSDPDVHAAAAEHLTADGRLSKYELQVRCKDGRLLDGLFSGEVVRHQDRESLLTVMVDITERKSAEQRLQESESRLSVITDAAQDAILMMTGDGRISYWNPAAERILGYTKREAIGQDLHALLASPRHRGSFAAAFPAFQKTGRGNAVGKSLDMDARRKDGIDISVELSLSSIKIDGEWHAVGLLRDITERKRDENALIEMNRQLAEATAMANTMAAEAEMASVAKSEFLANMSHEIRTPMNGIIGMTGLLLDTDLTDDQRRDAEIVRTAAESLLGLINDILDFSKIEAKKLDLEELDFDLSDLLDDLAATLALRAHAKGVEFACAADPEVPELLRGDPGRLRQVITNLTGNAVKFTERGEVAVRVSVVDEREDDVCLRFSVRDTGIGIPEEKIGVLFDKFSQVDASTTRKYGGTGLGLAISKQLTELMGGEIGVGSELGRGSEFWFTARFARQPGDARQPSPPPADLDGVRVLVVDDNATNREILTKRLSSWGMRPSEAADGEAGLAALRRAADDGVPFPLAVLDMQMPGMDGETLGRTIKADERLASTRLVMLTSLGSRGDARRFESLGFAAYATKPIRHQELKAMLARAMTREESGPRATVPITTRHSAREPGHRFDGRKGRILLAEDNLTNQRVALGILKKLGLQADAVGNGEQALAALAAAPYDLVLMDVQMPELDGLTATRRIRAGGGSIPNPRIPVIAMTAHAMQGDRDECLAAGMDDYVSKPVRPQALMEVLERWLPAEEPAPAVASEPAPPGPRPQAAAVAPPEPPVFDREGLMSRLLDDEDLAQKVLEGFLEDIPPRLRALGEHLEAGNAAGVELQAHTIKGASANVGAEALRAVALVVEETARAKDLAPVRGRAGDLQARFEQFKAAVARLL